MVIKTGNSRFPILRLAGLVVFLLALAAGGYLLLRRTEPGHRSAAPAEKVTIAHARLPYAALAQIAQARGYYREEGLDVTPLIYNYGKLALEAVLSGEADLATVAETPAMVAIMNGADLLLLATIQVSKQSHAIVARKDRGIATPEDLKRRRIGITFGTSGDFFLDAFLLANGIGIQEREVVNLIPEEMPDALAAGDIDAVSTWAPYLMEAQKKIGRRGVTFFDEDIYILTFNLVAKREFVNKNRGKVRRLLLALLKAEEFAKQNPREAQRLVAVFNGMDPATVSEMWKQNDFRLGLDQSLLPALEDESRWAIERGLTRRKTTPDFLDFIYLDGLQSVKPKGVNIVK